MGGSSSSSAKDSNDPDNTPIKHEGWSDIREMKRRPTDCFCLFLLCSAWITMTLIGFAACGIYKSKEIPVGKPERLTSPTDYRGQSCGHSTNVANKPYGYFMIDGTVVCVNSCPSETKYSNVICKYEYQAEAAISSYLRKTFLSSGSCMVQIATIEEFNSCIPEVSTSVINNAFQYYNLTSSSYSASDITESGSWFRSFITDILRQRGIIFGFGLGVSTFFAALYTYVLRIPGVITVTIWTCLVSIQVLLLVGSFLLWSLGNTWKNDGVHQNYQVLTIFVFAYTGMGCSVLYFCLMVVMRSRIQLAVGIVKEACKAVASMPIIFLLPIVQVTALTAFLVPWVIYVFYLAASGEIVLKTGSYTATGGFTTTYSYSTYEYADNTKYAFIYMMFSYYWTSEFLLACGQLVIALAFVGYYFTRDKKSVGTGTVIWAVKTTLFYHIGTAAFGSLIIAIIKTIRTVVAYIQRKAAKSNNKIVQYIMCAVGCCLWCLEKIMKFVSKNAYIQTAIHGYPFFKAARVGFFLLLRNVMRVSAVGMVSEFVLLIAKLFVPSLTVFTCYLVLAYGLPDKTAINGIVSPLVLVGIMSYFVALMFTEIFSMGIDALLFCYIADEEMFPAPADRFADGGLRTTIQQTAQTAAATKAIKVHPDDAKDQGHGEVLI